MPYIAKVANVAGAWTVTALQQGDLSQVAAADLPNWRSVAEVRPPVDNWTQVYTTPRAPSVSSDGSTVSITWNLETPPPVWTNMTLKNYAAQASMAKAVGGMTLPNGIQLATSSDQAGLIIDAIESLERGWLTEPVLFQAMNGNWVTLTLADLKAAGQAIAQFRAANYIARKAVYDAIDAGTITTSAQIDAAFAA